MGLFDRFFKSSSDKAVGKVENTDSEALNRELNQGLAKTRHGFMDKLFGMISGKEIDDDLYEELEEALISGDVGVQTALDLVENLRERERKDKLKTAEDLQKALAEELQARLAAPEEILDEVPGALNIILVVGVNGVGKTTSIGKMAHLLQKEGKQVLLAAGDTFRAAAADQLKIWGERVGCGIIAHQEGADPAAVVFDAIAAAKSRGIDWLIIDTAGRLHNKVNLMNELNKIRRIIDREAPEALREVLLVLDATTGQNALSQAKAFSEATGLTGVILTKLDGTAKGGVVIGINSEYDLPVKFVGVGEQMDQLLPFSADDFAEALFAGITDLDQEAEGAEETAEGPTAEDADLFEKEGVKSDD